MRKFGIKIDKNWDKPKLSADELRQKQCGEKELRTEKNAKTQAQLRTARGTPMSAYKCSFCGHWHIGTDWSI